MIPSLVEQEVEIKIHFENFTGILQSDYELGYALGKMMHILEMPLGEEVGVDELKEMVEAKKKDNQPKDFVETNLVRLIEQYKIQSQKGQEIWQLVNAGYQA